MDAHELGRVNVCMSWQFDAPVRPAPSPTHDGAQRVFPFERFPRASSQALIACSTDSEYYAN